MISPQEQELRAKKLKELRDHLTANGDNVGKKFPEEARKMHYGEIDTAPSTAARPHRRTPGSCTR